MCEGEHVSVSMLVLVCECEYVSMWVSEYVSMQVWVCECECEYMSVSMWVWVCECAMGVWVIHNSTLFVFFVANIQEN